METLLQEMREKLSKLRILLPIAFCAPNVLDEIADKWYQEFENVKPTQTPNIPQMVRQDEDWVDDYQTNNRSNEQAAANYNEKFWQRLQDEWAKLSEESDHPWLSEYDENFNPYKEYNFVKENPMQDIENALEKGVSQAENEMDPQAISALNRSLDIQPNNLRALMALAVCYTNESLQSQAVKMLTNWLQIHPKYKHLAPAQSESTTEQGAAMASSLIRGNKLHETQNMFLQAVRMDPHTIDPELQEALECYITFPRNMTRPLIVFKLLYKPIHKMQKFGIA
ncbi:Peroxisomal targeting signal 1 receptor [Eumeta japonica]|uniref:Peroxisomal targeting signal 1 receptor n=1 Tax=Eumeta variegata TaxID=151549 RepID=A0A4C1SX08_EUMVA|nr:Peroxisomal targeting signal 1 receptor [Eumeta japonica]